MNIKDYFKTCTSCNYLLPKTPTFFSKDLDKCINCNINEPHNFEKQSELKKEYLRDRMKQNVRNLSDEYVVNIIAGKGKGKRILKDKIKKDKDLIELAKCRIKLKREIIKWNSTKNT